MPRTPAPRSKVPYTSPQRAIAYIRVSTEQQATDGNSLAAQKEKLARYAEFHGVEIVAWEADAGVSASSLDRPGLQAALRRLDAFEANAILVVKLDRLTRSVRDLCDLVDSYFASGTHTLMSVSEQIDTSSAGGRMVLNMLMTVAQWEREAVAERTRAVMEHMKASGLFTGGFPPFGFYVNDDGALVRNEREQEIVTAVRRTHTTGAYSLREIGRLYPNPRTGKPFDPKQIQRMLTVTDEQTPSARR